MDIIIFKAILALCSSFAIYNSCRKCIHMLQLNSYQYPGYFRTIFRIRSWFIPFFFMCVFALPVALLFGNTYAAFIVVSVLYLLFGAVRKPDRYAKKKLVYTNRVKRLLITVCVLIAAGDAVLFFIPERAAMCLTVCFYALSTFTVLAANLINTPVEKLINLHYINDAKRILRETGAHIIGITGSYGKTSVKFYLSALLREKYDVLNTPSSYNTPLGIVRTVREHMSPLNEIFVCEMGARHVHDIKEICDIVHPDMGIITSIGEQHLETFHTFENIRKTKLELADAVDAKNHGLIFINADSVRDCDKLPYKNIITYGTTSACDYIADDVKLSQDGMEFTVRYGDESERYTTLLLGSHNILNLLGAIAVAHEMGIGFSELRRRVLRIAPVEHRQELRRMANGVIIDDAFNSNPAGAKSALETLSCFDGCRILITPGMVELGDREYELNREFGIQAAQVCDYVFLVGKVHTESIYDGLISQGFDKSRITTAPNFNDAMSQAQSMRCDGMKAILIENDLPDNY